MNLNQDIQKYRDGDRAAEMRLLSFIFECMKKANIDVLRRLSLENGVVGKEAKNGLLKCTQELARKRLDMQLKKQIKHTLEKLEQMLIAPKEEERSAIAANCRYLSSARWKLLIDQETYNIDLKIRQALDTVKRLGIKV